MSAALTGTIVTGGVTESEIVSGGQTLIITLTADTWVATVGADNAITTALIAGITSAQSEAAGWNAVVRAGLAFGDVARTSSTVVTVTLPAFASYSVTANETITVTVPAPALTGAVATVATPTFDVTRTTVVIASSAAGTLRAMCSANGLDATQDFNGSLALLAGIDNADPIRALTALGATSKEIVGAINQLAGTSGLELDGAVKAWAASGNF